MKLRITDSGDEEVYVFDRWCGRDDLDATEKRLISQGNDEELQKFFGL